jgi:hypothetical protein
LSKPVLFVNAILAGLAVFCAVLLFRDLSHARPIPAMPSPRSASGQASKLSDQAANSAARGDALAAYNVIAAKSLFNPSRSESSATPTSTAAPAGPKPLLMGVVVDGARSRAYLEDPASKRVLSYQIGDTVSGGQIEQITSERVLIARPEGSVELLLRDATKLTSPAPPGGGGIAAATAPAMVNAPVPAVGTRPVPSSRAVRRPVGEPPPRPQQ